MKINTLLRMTMVMILLASLASFFTLFLHNRA
jgi:hypothetical protein